MLWGKRFVFGVVSIIFVSITFCFFKWGMEPDKVLELAKIYATVIASIMGVFTIAQSITDVKEKNGGAK